ncbi:hypothetical protein ACR6HW_11640 [Fusibacter sp. JL298sf-3]
MKKILRILALTVLIAMASAASFADLKPAENFVYIFNGDVIEFEKAPKLGGEYDELWLPYEATLKLFGAEFKSTYALLDGIKIYSNGKNVLSNAEYRYTFQEPFEKSGGQTYMHAITLLEVIGYDAHIDYANNTLYVVKLDPKKAPKKVGKYKIAPPNTKPTYTISGKSNKHKDFDVLSGFPEQDVYTLYVASDILDNPDATYFIQRKKPLSMSDRGRITYNGISATVTRKEAYSHITDLLGRVNWSVIEKSFGQFAVDYFDDFDMNQRADEYVRDYINGAYRPDTIDFKIHDKDWLTLKELEKSYHLTLDTGGGFRQETPELIWSKDGFTLGYTYELPGYAQFQNGYLEFNKVRMIAQDGVLRLYRPDIETHVMPLLNAFIEPALNLQKQWVDETELSEVYGMAIYEGGLAGPANIASEDTHYWGFSYALGDFDLDRVGEQTVDGLTLKILKDKSIHFDKASFIKKVAEPYEAYRNETDSFSETWLSSSKLEEMPGIEIEKEFVPEKTKGSFYEFTIVANGKSYRLEGLTDARHSKTGEHVFGGIRVYIFSEHGYSLHVEDLKRLGIID